MFRHLLLGNRYQEHAHDGVEETRVFPDNVDRGECVQVYRTAPARAIVYERRNKVPRAVEERDVIGVGGDARGVKGDHDVDCRCRRILRLVLHGIRKVWRKRRGKEIRHFLFIPYGGDAIRELSGLQPV